MNRSGALKKKHGLPHNVTLEHLALLGIYLFALSWPLDAFQRILWPIHLYHLALVPAFCCAGYDLKRNKRLRTPFELWWPCLVIFLLTLYLWLTNHTVNPLGVGMLCLSFVVVAHVVRNRQVVLQTLSLFLLSVCLMMVLSLFSACRQLFPTAVNLDSRWVMAGPYTVQAGIFIIIVGLLLLPALGMAVKRGEFRPGKGRMALGILLPILFVVFIIVSPRFDLSLTYPGHVTFLAPTVFPVVILLWGMARIMGKLKVAAKFMEPGVYTWLIVMLFAAVVVLVWVAPVPAIGHVVLLAVIAGYGQPYVVAESKTRMRPLLVVLVLLVLAVNIAVILPGDPRNYERSAQAALTQKKLDNTLRHLEFVKEIAPEESLADFYIAVAHLKKEELSQAAKAFTHSLRDSKTRLLPAPDEQHIVMFLDEMRAKSSALPERIRGLAYEQALVAAGRERHALSLLELRGTSAGEGALSTWPLASVLAAMLKAPQLTETLADWNPNLLATILESASPGNKRVVPPEGFPETLLPLVAMASNEDGQDIIQVFTPQGAFGGVRVSADDPLAFVDVTLAISPPEWREWQKNPAGLWTLAFGKVAEIHIMNSPEVFFSVYPTPPGDNIPDVVIFMPEK